MGVKTIKLGNKTKNQKGRDKIVLGNPNAEKEAYRFTVKVRIERPGQDPVTLVNPSLFFNDPHEKAPSWIEAEVVTYEDDGN